MNAGLYVNGVEVQRFDYEDELNRQFVDFEIKCANDTSVHAHKIILSSRAEYFKALFRTHPQMNNIVFGDANIELMERVMRMIYGEIIHVPQLHLEPFNALCTNMRVNHWVKYEPLVLGTGSGDSSMQTSQSTTPTEVYCEVLKQHL
ncbi:uncharacterized protein BDFB_007227 [Asbolus verrucosus]|uniref:BTB domain-containing protein n=1 Tax=Asbolus verrucosus TaxID=1661398 RepID=A0A482VSL2_ASBVE|nr:uncharacterized protein BDFB_007227 [Asbolus verrucosus]